MNRGIVTGLHKQFKRVARYYDQFIDACPDELWLSVMGRLPVWQNVYHTVDGIYFFMRDHDEEREIAPLHPHEVAIFQKMDVVPTSRQEMKDFSIRMNDYAARRFGALKDADLTKKHLGFSERINAESDYNCMLNGLVGHHFYHLGLCDTVLRENGIEGIF